MRALCACAGAAAHRADAGHFGLDPGFGAGIDFAGAESGRIDRWTDTDGDPPGLLEEGIAAPEFTRIERYRQNQGTGFDAQMGAADLEAPLMAGRGARAFGEDDDRIAFVEPVATLVNQLLQRIFAGAAIDRNHRDYGQRPAEERQLLELFFPDVEHQREDFLQNQRLPSRLMFAQDNNRLGRNILATTQLIGNAQHMLDQPDREADPGLDREASSAMRQPEAEDHAQRVRRRDDHQDQHEQDRAQHAD